MMHLPTAKTLPRFVCLGIFTSSRFITRLERRVGICPFSDLFGPDLRRAAVAYLAVTGPTGLRVFQRIDIELSMKAPFQTETVPTGLVVATDRAANH
jgi:hypothetical protein